MDIASLLSGAVGPEFSGLLQKGRFISKNTIEVGDIVEFIYETKRKYMFVVASNYQDKVHGIDLNHIDISDFTTIITEYVNLGMAGGAYTNTRVDSEALYERVKPIVSRTRSYRTYKSGLITRTRIIKYVGLIG